MRRSGEIVGGRICKGAEGGAVIGGWICVCAAAGAATQALSAHRIAIEGRRMSNPKLFPLA
jgi:hypothetical protein